VKAYILTNDNWMLGTNSHNKKKEENLSYLNSSNIDDENIYIYIYKTPVVDDEGKQKKKMKKEKEVVKCSRPIFPWSNVYNTIFSLSLSPFLTILKRLFFLVFLIFIDQTKFLIEKTFCRCFCQTRFILFRRLTFLWI